MKIALCFSGGLRNLNDTKDFWQGLIAKYDVDVYGSFWDDINSESGDTVENFTEFYSPKAIELDNYEAFKTSTQDIASLYIKSPNLITEFFQNTSKTFGQLSMYEEITRNLGSQGLSLIKTIK